MNLQLLKFVSSGICLMLLGTQVGCMHARGYEHPRGNSGSKVIRLLLHGPYAVVVGEDGVTALVPRGDEEHAIEIVSPFPILHEKPAQAGGCKTSSVFELRGVESASAITIDPAFRPVTFSIAGWKPPAGNQELFVTAKLPLPRSLDAIGRLYDVHFASNPDKPMGVPLTQSLEFTTKDAGKVELVRTETRTCGAGKPSSKVETFPALPCGKFKKRYDDYFKSIEDRDGEESQRPYLRHEFERCTDDTWFLYMGVGLHPGTFSELDNEARHGRFEDIGRNFFNKKLLPLVYGGEGNIPPGKKLVPHRDPVTAAPRYLSQNPWSSPQLIPAAYQVHRLLRAYYMFASTENCTSPPVVVH